MAQIAVQDFGSSETPAETISTFRKAIACLRSGDTLSLEKREYRLEAPLVFSSLQDVEIQGNGAALINLNFNPRTLERQNLTILQLVDCARMKIGGFSLDYDKGMNLTGTLVP